MDEALNLTRKTIARIVVLAGVSGLSVVVLIVLTAVTGSWVAGVLAVTVSIGVVSALCILLLKLVRKLIGLDDAVSTFSRGADTRSRRIADSLLALEMRAAESDVKGQALRRDLQVLRRRVPAGFLTPIEEQLASLQSTSIETLKFSFETAVEVGQQGTVSISDEQVDTLFNNYLARSELLQLRPLIDNFGPLDRQTPTTLRRLYRFYKGAGYWDVATKIVEKIHDKTQLPSDFLAAQRLHQDIEFFKNPNATPADLLEGEAYDSAGAILHIVGRILPSTQSGYTLRTHYSARAQMRRGLPVAIVCQSGAGSPAAHEAEYEHNGVKYYLLPGPARNEVPLTDWVQKNIEELAALVLRLRPSVLHAQSDFFNVLIASAVGRHYGIPVVYEVRGFWEESWLSRTVAANNWSKRDSGYFRRYGLPMAYELRRGAEEEARLLADHVFTLAQVMRDHILDSAGEVCAPKSVSIVPNAVEESEFPVQEPDTDLASTLGIPEGAVTVGYISSIVEYEGIGTLLDAFRLVQTESDQVLRLLIVGDGDHLLELKAYAESINLLDVIFTGRVPHEQVLKYYGLIDVFVVPREKSTVTELVTPLKPFEAFSTGRAVILSDVAALSEIANQSGAVETFRAGDPEDLARKIARLVLDPHRRRTLGLQAARWVRNHRSWDQNVNEYYRVYRSLGFSGARSLLTEAEISLSENGINSGELLEELAGAELTHSRGWYTIQEPKQTARSILENGWRFGGFEPVPVKGLVDWSKYGCEHRSWGFHLHAWEFMDAFIDEYDRTENTDLLSEAIEIAVGWVTKHHGSDVDEDEMAWYDMALSLRTPRLISLVLRAARTEGMRESAVILAASLVLHLFELQRDRAFNPNNNHGFYTSVSQVHAAKYVSMLPSASSSGEQGRKRLSQMAASQFAPDGVHLEHSPDYHRMLLNSFELAVKDALIEDEEVKGRVRLAANVLGWMVQPDGVLVQFGDSPETSVVKPTAVSLDPETLFILTDGERGVVPSKELAVFSEGGYAFVRSPQPLFPGSLGDSGYLAFSAAFHSRAHKHADDLNVVWYDRRHQILVDGGRFGYGELLPTDSVLRQDGFYYGMPERQYVEGTMAHNTVMMDGRNQERRTRKPYGSALGECVEKPGVFDLSGRVSHTDYVHRRRVVYRPGAELLIKDSVFSHREEERQGVVWFNIDGDFELDSGSPDLEFIHPQSGLKLTVVSDGNLIAPVRGQKEPLRGWTSRKDGTFEPVWSVGFAFSVADRASINTTLNLHSE